VKGGLDGMRPDASFQNLRRSVTAINDALGGAKRLDLFESARVDPNVLIEDAVTRLKALIDEGLFDYIGLSECAADTLRRAHKVHPLPRSRSRCRCGRTSPRPRKVGHPTCVKINRLNVLSDIYG
jgi:aryl-alcohol dehydrogenase-like predicted oxidoreductase